MAEGHRRTHGKTDTADAARWDDARSVPRHPRELGLEPVPLHRQQSVQSAGAAAGYAPARLYVRRAHPALSGEGAAYPRRERCFPDTASPLGRTLGPGSMSLLVSLIYDKNLR